MPYRIADANEYVVVTGSGIENLKIVKKAFVWPFQKSNVISIAPFDFEITLQAMTMEKLSFCLPAVFTIGPYDEPEALMKYAQLLSGNFQNESKSTPKTNINASARGHVQQIVKGIIEGETRVIVSSMTMEEIFRERQVFKDKVIQSVQAELNQFGLRIYNANVKELQDSPGSEYFTFLSRKAHEGASNQAKVDVANARMMGEIGEAEKRGRQRQEISKIEAQTAVLETERKSDKAKADAELKKTNARLGMDVQLAEIQARRAAESRDAEMQKDVELKRADMELERRRATDLVTAKIERESAMQRADAKAYAEKTAAAAELYKRQLAADADLYQTQKDADGLITKAQAMAQMSQALGGPQYLMQYLMLERGTYEHLANANAKAVQGMQPKISHWSGMGGSGGSSGNAVADIYKSLPPLLSTIQEQTGLMPPEWLARSAAPEPHREVARTNGKQTNGFSHDESH